MSIFKTTLKTLLTRTLGWQVKRLIGRNDIKVVAVAGSVGKTTTKYVIARYLQGGGKKVRYQHGNYNTPLSVPLIFFNEQMPSLYNPLSWFRLLYRNERQVRLPYPFHVVVVELGIDQPGEMMQFSNYLKPDVSVMTAISPEHMEFFESLEHVAKEELRITAFSKRVIANVDDIDTAYIKILNPVATYGTDEKADYRLFAHSDRLTIKSPQESIKFKTSFVGEHVQKAFCAAVAVADELGIVIEKSSDVLETIQPMAGRMQLLDGLHGSRIIDDTYNNVSHIPLMAALDVLYAWPANKRIAVIGNMNELGSMSRELHYKIGAYCDPSKLDMVITIGPDAVRYTAAAARKNGCRVEGFESPYEVGTYLGALLDKDTVVLVKGSQNKVYLEEAVKQVLKHASDEKKLVRQSAEWLRKKEKQFKKR